MRDRGRGLGDVEPVAVRGEDGVDADFVALRHQHRTVDGVFEFADIARQRLVVSTRLVIGRKQPRRHAIGVGIFLHEMLRQFENVGRPVAQRRDVQVATLSRNSRSSRKLP